MNKIFKVYTILMILSFIQTAMIFRKEEYENIGDVCCRRGLSNVDVNTSNIKYLSDLLRSNCVDSAYVTGYNGQKCNLVLRQNQSLTQFDNLTNSTCFALCTNQQNINLCPTNNNFDRVVYCEPNNYNVCENISSVNSPPSISPPFVLQIAYPPLQKAMSKRSSCAPAKKKSKPQSVAKSKSNCKPTPDPVLVPCQFVVKDWHSESSTTSDSEGSDYQPPVRPIEESSSGTSSSESSSSSNCDQSSSSSESSKLSKRRLKEKYKCKPLKERHRGPLSKSNTTSPSQKNTLDDSLHNTKKQINPKESYRSNRALEKDPRHATTRVFTSSSKEHELFNNNQKKKMTYYPAKGVKIKSAEFYYQKDNPKFDSKKIYGHIVDLLKSKNGYCKNKNVLNRKKKKRALSEVFKTASQDPEDIKRIIETLRKSRNEIYGMNGIQVANATNIRFIEEKNAKNIGGNKSVGTA